MMVYEVKDVNGRLVADLADTDPPDRDPDFPQANVGTNTSDWCDYLVDLFQPWVDKFKITVVAAIDDQGNLRGWVRQSD